MLPALDLEFFYKEEFSDAGCQILGANKSVCDGHTYRLT
jgi:hypothetical protein